MTITENLQLLDKNLSCLKIDSKIRYLPQIYPKINSIILVNKIETLLLNDLLNNKNLIDFLCVNIQEIARQMSPKYRKFIKSQNEDESVFLFRKFGFINDSSFKKDDDEIYYYLKNLTNNFATQIEWLSSKKIIDFSKDKVQGFESYILNPFLHLLRSSGINKLSFNKEAIYFDLEDRHVQNLFSAWQNKTIFERIVAKIIEEKLKCKVYCSKFIVINSNDPLNYSLEFDNIFVHNNKICFIELKNGEIRRNDVFEFLGKVKAVESYYNFKVDKIAVIGTKQKEPIFDELENKMQNFKVFDIANYRNNFEPFFSFIMK